MTYYTTFSIVKVFEDPRLNVFFNQLYSSLITVFSEDIVSKYFLIDGKLALIMQEIDPIPPTFTKIEFSTSNVEIFRYLKLNLKLFSIKELLISDNLIIIKTITDHNVYFNFVNTAMDAVDVKISVRNSSEIL
jgi:hypothetical protein